MSFGDPQQPVGIQVNASGKVQCPYFASDKAIEWARTSGLEVTIPAANEIFLDLDDDASFEVFNRNRDVIEGFLKITHIKETVSRSGNKHLYIGFERDISMMERIALQAVLGSDRRAVAHQIRRHVENDPVPVMFFEKSPTPKNIIGV